MMINTLFWLEQDENISIVDDQQKVKVKQQYVIKVFGKTIDNESIYLRIDGFQPFFFFEIPQNIINNNSIEKLIDVILSYNFFIKKSFQSFEIVNCKKLYGFTGDQQTKFVKMIFDQKSSMKQCSNYLIYNQILFNNKQVKLNVYESNIDPYLRFLHINDIQPIGWINIQQENLYENQDDFPYQGCQYAVQSHHIEKYIHDKPAQFKICSFDIECTSCDNQFPQAIRPSDQIIQIGATFNLYGQKQICDRYIFVLGSCDPIENCVVVSVKTEKELLIKFAKMIQKQDPDIIIGYNIFGFDFDYIYQRSKLPIINCSEKFQQLSKLKNTDCQFIERFLSSSALGDNIMKMYEITGRIQIDLLKVIQREYKLDQFKLDYVAEFFIQNDILKIEFINDQSVITTKDLLFLQEENYIKIIHSEDTDENKYKISNVNQLMKQFTIPLIPKKYLQLQQLKWGLVKDDIKPYEIFQKQKGSSTDRAVIAKYCLQDCALVNHLLNKLEILPNNISMANVCFVPLDFIFFRGQSIKSLSLVSQQCRLHNILIPVNQKDENLINQKYEGAYVIDPKPFFHTQPIVVLDYNSLYPSSIIDYNISHETLVMDDAFLNLPGYQYDSVEYNDNSQKQIDIDKDQMMMDADLDNNIQLCHQQQQQLKIKCTFVKNKPGIIPIILQSLLVQRKKKKQQMEQEQDSFKKSILNGEQNALKVTANSIYGQLGAPTSPIYLKKLAACTTAVGRYMLNHAKNFTEQQFNPILEQLKTAINDEHLFTSIVQSQIKNPDQQVIQFVKQTIQLIQNLIVKPSIIYGDTDSIFINFNLQGLVTNDNPLYISIELGKLLSKILKQTLRSPHNMEYEKTFYPFIIMGMKKYIGNKYENDIHKFKQSQTGIVLVRRDNAKCVKKIIGGFVRFLLNDGMDFDKAIRYLKKQIKSLLDGEFPISDFITSKNLKANYKNKNSIAHAVLAERMEKRQDQFKPQVNDRIQYVHIVSNKKKQLQGEKIEHPQFIKDNNLKIDYKFYLTNQIQNPAMQFLELITDKPYDVINRLIIDYDNEQQSQQTLLNFFKIKK